MEPILADPADRQSEFPGTLPLERTERVWAFVAGAIMIGLLIVARCLSPSPVGMGTHQQLGLPPCTFDTLLGMRCPTCGMTTSWAYVTRGQVVSAWQANPGGVCLAIVSLVCGVWPWAMAWRGRYWALMSTKWSLAILLAIAALTLLDWAVRVT